MRRKKLQKAGQIPAEFPKIDLNDRMFRHGLDIVLVATIVNLLVVAMASYRGAAYMDSPQFCGQSCHVMHPEYTAYKISAHSHVACVECHIGSGAQAYFSAKVNGTKQLLEVTFDRYPTPIPSPVTSLRPARFTCEGCHTPAKFVGEKLLVKSNFADDEQNTETPDRAGTAPGRRRFALPPVGHSRRSLESHGIHCDRQGPDRPFPGCRRENADGSETVFAASALNGAMPQGERRVMDCIDCHNRAAHTFATAEEALNRAMADGAISADLPFVHKEGLELLNGDLRQPGRGARKDSRAA